MHSGTLSSTPRSWLSAYPDLIAFVIGLGVAWSRGWNTTDLVWSLWLSSLVVGFAMIFWSVIQPVLELIGLRWKHRANMPEVYVSPSAGEWVVLSTIALVGAVLFVAFFTLHFGGFHLAQSGFLLHSYPLGDGFHFMNATTLDEIVRRYWSALPSAFLARRRAFTERTFAGRGTASRASSATRLPREPGTPTPAQETLLGNRIVAPYYQVARMHLVIILLTAVRSAGLENIAVYAFVYALYFFPWRLLRRSAVEPEEASGAALGARA